MRHPIDVVLVYRQYIEAESEQAAAEEAYKRFRDGTPIAPSWSGALSGQENGEGLALLERLIPFSAWLAPVDSVIA